MTMARWRDWVYIEFEIPNLLVFIRVIASSSDLILEMATIGPNDSDANRSLISSTPIITVGLKNRPLSSAS